MVDIVTLGETMIRFTPPIGETVETASVYQVDLGGAESNAAVALARLGLSVGWISRLPATAVGRRVAGQLRSHGVDTSRVIWSTGDRVGTYYLEPGRTPRPVNVIYDRAGSAFSRIEPDEVDWPYIHTAQWLHMTGITPALGPGPHRTVERAIQEALAHNTIVSFDVNYRSKLWSPQEAAATLTPFLQQATIIQCGNRDAALLFGTSASGLEAARSLYERFQPRLVIVTEGEAGAYAYDGSDHHAPAVPVDTLDPVGSGDAFAAGFIAGYLAGGVDQGLTWGCALAALKRTYWGDMMLGNREELQAVLDGVERGILR